MGLDMYLEARAPVYEYLVGEDKYNLIQRTVRGVLENVPTEWEAKEIKFQAMYWRKANHIHKWFVDNVQEGKDDCGSYYVEYKKLVELVGVCRQVLADPSRAQELLPTQSGFFFGGTEYDEFYISDIRATIQGLQPLLDEKLFKQFDIYYHSSW